MTAKDTTTADRDGAVKASVPAAWYDIVDPARLISLMLDEIEAAKGLALAYALGGDADTDSSDKIHLIVDGAGTIYRGARWDRTSRPRVLICDVGKDAKAKAGHKLSADFIQAFLAAKAAYNQESLVAMCRTDPLLKERWDALEAWFGDLAPPHETAATSSGIAVYDGKRAARGGYRPAGAFTGSDEQIELLKLHVVNLRRGKLSDGGIMRTTAADLDKMVENIAQQCAAGGKKLVFYAHGGLTSEESGLAAAWAYHGWWMAHGVYPVFFVWETSGLETLWQIIGAKFGRTRAVPRDIFDAITDPAVEALAAGPGSLLWRAMKDSAELASAKDGGATMLADKLSVAFSGQQPPDVYAIGHSAGSIFHAHFLPRLLGSWQGATIDQLHLLAPAITLKLYEKAFKNHPIKTHMFTMKRQAERDDNCGGVYRKSLLYLVSNAFEDGSEKPILGMADFWPDPATKAIVPEWSPGPATRATSHGGFDNDPATMESVLRLILGADASTHIDPGFPPGDPPRARATPSPANYYGMSDDTRAMFAGPQAGAAGPGGAFTTAAPAASGIALGGQRRALCIGNDRFPPGMELSGCVNDAQAWAATFEQIGATAVVLPDATADQMRAAIRDLVTRAGPDDAIAIHISSHGTQVPDLDGDERLDDQFADELDEAVIGIDWDRGGMIVDDEWPALLEARPGVHIVRFHDFCHAGRTSRMLVRPGRRNRSVRVSDEVARRAALASPTQTRGAGAAVGYAQELPYLTFCACQPHQLSGEVNGMGLFSRAAKDLLRGRGAAMTYSQLADEIGRALSGEDQQPMIEGPGAMAAMKLFGGR